MSDISKILIVAGGTGGHIFPALAIARELKRHSIDIEWLGSTDGMENIIVPKNGIKLHDVHAVGLRGKSLKKLIMAPFFLSFAILQTFKIILKVKPDMVIGMGGFVSGIGGIVSKMMSIPLVIHEQNAIPGTTNRILSKIASQTFQAFDNTFDTRINAITCGNPIAFHVVDKEGSHSKLNLLVLGGSLGANSINETIPKLSIDMNIWHQTGENHIQHVRSMYAQSDNQKSTLKIEPFIEDMAEAYAWADIVICRSGAMTISELIATKSVAILVPFPYAINDHQTKNAMILSDLGAAILIKEDKLNPNMLDKIIENIDLKDMTTRLQSIENIDSVKLITDYLLMPSLSNKS
jgi:UDP-N-acetylglucosamine--N-acetylmuramyl-(pentapeptide) pyrophosphoryl-undecaprenol N-acetylglucosamine transferase